MSEALKIFIGWDAREDIAYKVCRYSLLRRTSAPLNIHPLRVKALKHQKYFHRPFEEKDGQWIDLRDGKPFSTEFTFTRFLVPHLAGHKGWALFCDCDFLFTADVAELFALADARYAVMVVKHVHEPRERKKMDGRQQTAYPRKNWSSLILWNCEHAANRPLSIYRVNWKSGRWLHGFKWLPRERMIGELPQTWNWLSGVNDPPSEGSAPKGIHFTLGGPWFENCQDVPYAGLWTRERELMESENAAPRQKNVLLKLFGD